MNLYEALGVKPDATADEIKLAYRRAAIIYHPDKNGGDSSRMAIVNDAYAVLSDSARREQYDRTGSAAQGPSADNQARDLLLNLLGQIICGDSDCILRDLKHMLISSRQNIELGMDANKQRARKFESCRGKVRVKKGDDLPEMLITQQLNNLAQALDTLRAAQNVMLCAEEMLKHWEQDEPPVPDFGMSMLNTQTGKYFNPIQGY